MQHKVLQQWTEPYPPHGTVNRIVDIIRDRLDIIIEMIDGIVVIIHTGAAAAEGAAAAITTIDGAEEAPDNREILAIDSVDPPQPL